MRKINVFKTLLLVFMFILGSMVLVTSPATSLQQTDSTVEPWPQYRHDQRNTGSINSYGPSLKEPLWVSTLNGSPPTTGVHSGRSAPAVADDKIFVTPKKILPKAFSINGDLIWDGSPSGLSLTTPNVDPELGLAVYADAPSGYVYCANISTGEPVWTTYLGNDSYTLAAPTIDPVEKKVVINMFFMLARENEYTVALDLETGEILWKAGPWFNYVVSASGGSTSTPAIHGGRVYFGAEDGRVYSLSLEDGSEFWSYETEGTIEGAVSVGTNGLVYAGSHDGYFRAFVASNGTLVWQYECGIYQGDSVYGCALDETRGLVIVPQANGSLSALDWNTGEEVWRSKLPDWTGGDYRAGTQPGDTTGATAGQFCPGTSLPAISLRDRKVFIQGVNNTYVGWGHEGIFCFDINTGTMMDWYIYPGGASAAPRPPDKGLVVPSPSMAEGRLYAGTYNRNDLYCFSLSTPLTPVAAFAYAPTNPIFNETVTFDASASFHPNGTIEAYTWDFGDGTFANETNPLTYHTFTFPRVYNVILTVFDNEGLNGTAEKSISIIKIASNLLISASPSTLPLRQNTTLSGSLIPEREHANVTIWARSGSDWVIIANVTTDENSSYSQVWTPFGLGSYTIKANWTGDNYTFLSESTTLIVTCTRIPTSISIFTNCSSTLHGFKVEVKGTLSEIYGGCLKGETIFLSYTFAGIGIWIPIISDSTDDLGEYQIVWFPPATGNYLLNAEWSGNSSHFGISNTIAVSTISYQNEYIFAVESNSTISALAFNTTDWTLSFTATGSNGTRGYTKVTIAKSLIADITNIRVYLDDNQTEYSVSSLDDSWLLAFTYAHSVHQIRVDLDIYIIPEFSSSLVLPLFIITTLLSVVCVKKRKRNYRLGKTQKNS